MKQNTKPIELNQKLNNKRCGAITCINNICGQCDVEDCELYEKVLIQEH